MGFRQRENDAQFCEMGFRKRENDARFNTALDAEIESFSEVIGDFGGEEFSDSSFDVVGESEEFDRLCLGIVDRTTCAVIIIARLSDRTDGDEILFIGFECYRRCRDIDGIVFGECERFGEVGVPDKCDVIEVFEVGQELERLLDEKDVVEFGRFDGGTVANRKALAVFVHIWEVA